MPRFALGTSEPRSRSIKAAPLLVALGVGMGLVLAFHVAGTLLLVFAGMLVAAVLDAAVVALGRVLPWSRGVRLAIVTLVMLAGLAALIVYGGISLVGQSREMANAAFGQYRQLADLLAGYGVELPQPEGETFSPADLMPRANVLFGHARTAFGVMIGVAGNALILLFLGLFFAAHPAAYRDGFVRLLPPERRERVAAVLTEAGNSLRWWLIGQLAMMAMVAVTVGAMLWLVGIPNALLLGLVSGLLNFIPFLGPILAAVPVFLAAVPEGPSTLLLVVSLFTVIRSIEGYLIGPLIAQRAVHIPPAWALAALMVAGSLFGGIGVALATPMLAALRIVVIRLYVEDVLEARARPG